VRTWDAGTLTLLQEMLVSEAGYLQTMTLTESNILLVGGIDSILYEIDLAQWQVTQTPLPLNPDFEAAISPDGKYIAVRGGDSTLRVWSTLDKAWVFFEEVPYLFDLTFSEGMNSLIGVTLNRSMIVWNLDPSITQTGYYEFDNRIETVHAIAGTSYVALIDTENIFLIFDLASGTSVTTLEAVEVISTASTENYLILAQLDGTIRLWRTDTFEELSPLIESQTNGRSIVRPGLDSRHFFTRAFNRNNTPEENALRYWRIPDDNSEPTLEWTFLMEDLGGFYPLEAGRIVLFGHADGLLITQFDEQGNPSRTTYPVENLDGFAVSNSGETLVGVVQNQLMVWQPQTSQETP
jgi:WD40 repeat protein